MNIMPLDSIFMAGGYYSLWVWFPLPIAPIFFVVATLHLKRQVHGFVSPAKSGFVRDHDVVTTGHITMLYFTLSIHGH